MAINKFAESAKPFARNPLGIIALFIILVYGFASLVVSFGNNLADHVIPLIYFLVIFPIIVFFGFLWLVAKHHNKLYAPSDFKDESNYVRVAGAVASLTLAVNKQAGGIKAIPTKLQLNDAVKLVLKATKSADNIERSNRILWVDDRPENNIYERGAFEAQGIDITLARSTKEAIDKIKTDNYSAIISDMGRKEGPQEGYVLLDKLRSGGNKVPFFIYAGSDDPKHKRMASERGAQGSTNRPDELYQLVMDALSKQS